MTFTFYTFHSNLLILIFSRSTGRKRCVRCIIFQAFDTMELRKGENMNKIKRFSSILLLVRFLFCSSSTTQYKKKKQIRIYFFSKKKPVRAIITVCELLCCCCCCCHFLYEFSHIIACYSCLFSPFWVEKLVLYRIESVVLFDSESVVHTKYIYIHIVWHSADNLINCEAHTDSFDEQRLRT